MELIFVSAHIFLNGAVDGGGVAVAQDGGVFFDPLSDGFRIGVAFHLGGIGVVDVGSDGDMVAVAHDDGGQAMVVGRHADQCEGGRRRRRGEGEMAVGGRHGDAFEAAVGKVGERDILRSYASDGAFDDEIVIAGTALQQKGEQGDESGYVTFQCDACFGC